MRNHAQVQKCICLLLIFPTLILFSIYAQAEKKEISFYAVSANPWGYEENGIKKGIIVDWARAIMKEAGFTMHINFAPTIRIIRGLQTGAADARLQRRCHHH